MTEYEQYEELRQFLGGRLWTEVLKPRMQAWADAKTAAMAASKTPAELWDARTAADAAKEALPLIGDALVELQRKLVDEQTPPTSAM